MGTEQHEVYRGPCHCGSGQVVINHCMPDHPWVRVTSGWFETSISCESCQSKFELVEQNNNIVVVNKSDIKAKEELRSEWHKRGNNLMAWPDVQKLLKQFEALLNDQPSMAACHRLLKANNFLFETVGTFRKKWQGAEDWIKKNIRPSSLDKLMVLLNQNNQEISQEIMELNSLWEKIQEPFPIVGKPIFKTSQ